jgi:hypothetical protein
MTVKISTEMKILQWYKMDFNHPTSNPPESSGISWDLVITLFFCYIKKITFLSSFMMHCMIEFW